jgi:predicted DsbA family dithiol-disulfide isomerase
VRAGYTYRMEVAPGTIVLYGDIACPWATCAVSRIRRTRRELGLDGTVVIDHRAFALELINRRPTPKLTVDAEVPVVGGIERDFGFQVWSQPEWTWPVSVLLALEAVQVAKAQSMQVSEDLDVALRRAMFVEGRCISLRSVVLDIASECTGVDVDALVKGLDAGDGRRAVLEQVTAAERMDVKGSPHLFLTDGSDHHNPGIAMHWEGKPGEGFPVVDSDDPSIYIRLLRS